MVPVAAVLIPRLQSMHVAPDPNAVEMKGRKRFAFFAAVGTGMLQLAGQRLDLMALFLAVVSVSRLGLQHPQTAPSRAPSASSVVCPRLSCSRGFFAGAFFATEWFIPLLLRQRASLSFALAGGALSGAAVGWFFGSWYQGRLRPHYLGIPTGSLGAFMTTLGIGLSALNRH